ncbi:MAG TPA: hypothetical protein DCM86_17380 [Verrucomicrobiales bacterium]|nr:hypothetical protein [Verrucomicrobiales bacterium]
MKPRKPQSSWRRWAFPAVVCCLEFSRKASAQARFEPRFVEPRWLTLDISEVSAGVQAEGTFDSSSYKNSNISVSHESLFVGPSVGMAASGSIYHPNFLRYHINTDGAFGYGSDRFTAANTTLSRSTLHYLGRFGTDIDFLPGKSYNANLFTNYDHAYRDNDFFDRVVVDSWRYGGKFGWHFANWNISTHYTHRDEESNNSYPLIQGTGSSNQVTVEQRMATHEDTAGITARNDRGSGGSTLSYSFDQYNHDQADRFGEGTGQTIAFADGERFGSREQFRLNSNVSYSMRDTTEGRDNDLSSGIDFSAEHTPRLNSFYGVNYEHYDALGFASDTYSGSASLNHQLFESLGSSITIRASETDSAGDSFSGYVRRFGGGITEMYTKRLGEQARLRVSNAVFIDHTDQHAINIIENERHSIGEPGSPFADSFYLSAPSAILATVVITDGLNIQRFIENFHYQLIAEGSRTRVQWLYPPGNPVPPSLLATYRTEPTPEGSYDTLAEGCQVRLELWNNLVGVYGRANFALNNAPLDLHVLNTESYTFGSDVNWRWLRAGAEYEIYNSTESDYRTARLYQSAVFHVDDESTLSVSFTESWVQYVSLNRSPEETFRFITRYHRMLTDRLDVSLEGGTAIRRGSGADQFLGTVRPSIRYVIGKTSIDLSYDYDYSVFQDRETREKSIFAFRARRTF